MAILRTRTASRKISTDSNEKVDGYSGNSDEIDKDDDREAKFEEE